MSGKQYHTLTTGEAKKTAEAHTDESEMTLFSACFCPFVHRAWIAMEYLGLPYRYFEVDPYKKPPELLEVSPRGLVPGLKLAGQPPRAISESTVIMEYLDEIAKHRNVLPPLSKPYERAMARYIADHTNRNVIPAFYRYLQAQQTDKQAEGAHDFAEGLVKHCDLLEKAAKVGNREAAGLWLADGDLSWADAMLAPWLLRSTNVLKHYRGWQNPDRKGYKEYLDRVLAHPAVKATTSTDELYLDSYARYAENRPNTSQVANAINSGRGLP